MVAEPRWFWIAACSVCVLAVILLTTAPGRWTPVVVAFVGVAAVRRSLSAQPREQSSTPLPAQPCEWSSAPLSAHPREQSPTSPSAPLSRKGVAQTHRRGAEWAVHAWAKLYNKVLRLGFKNRCWASLGHHLREIKARGK